jgi:hypothetical protein
MKRVIVIGLITWWIVTAAGAPRKLFIEARQKQYRNVTLELTKSITRKCPQIHHGY